MKINEKRLLCLNKTKISNKSIGKIWSILLKVSSKIYYKIYFNPALIIRFVLCYSTVFMRDLVYLKYGDNNIKHD